jgi:hypothetical protein
MPKQRWERLLREFRKLVFGTCCALGALGGLWTGIWTNAEPQPRGDIGDDLVRLFKPMLAHFGVGLGIGVALGLAICLTVLRPRSPGHQ